MTNVKVIIQLTNGKIIEKIVRYINFKDIPTQFKNKDDFIIFTDDFIVKRELIDIINITHIIN